MFSGYARHFEGSGKRDDRAYISRGTRLQESRCYFADAAAQSYLNGLVGGDDPQRMVDEVIQVLRDLNVAMFTIVEAFIQRRRYSFRPEAE
jgi:hypothetical protein